MVEPATNRHELVLVGGGHAHVQVLRALMMEPEAETRTTVVLDRPVAVYSGMVPAFVAGDYALADLEIDVVPLARRAGAAVVLARAEHIDPIAKLIYLRGRPPLPYDIASINVGSTVQDLDVPGVREHALSTRPIGVFAAAVDARTSRLGLLDRTAHVVVVGAGAGGCELAGTLSNRIERGTGRAPRVTLLDSHDSLLPSYPEATQRLVRGECARRGIDVITEARVEAVGAESITLLDGRTLPCDLAVWVTGAAPPPMISASGLERDPRGFALVRSTLQTLGHDDLFAVGDCAAMPQFPWVKKAGVYAVRQGPVLTQNLRARLRGSPLTTFKPQRDFLSLLYLGNGRAVASKWGQARAGAWVWRLKDHIDRSFMERFQVLAPDGSPAPTFPLMEPMEKMACGGCAAKVGQDILEAALADLPPPLKDPSVLLGLEQADDAAALTTPAGDTLVTTVDAFEAFTDDPYLVGRIAAVNAISDLYAKGVDGAHALAIVGVPEGPPSQVRFQLTQALHGVRAALDSRGITLLGGHTIRAQKLTVGLTVTGFLSSGDRLLANGGMREGDVLILSKPLGTGVLFHADMQGQAAGRHLAEALDGMQEDNHDASVVAREWASAATDISGFGLAGHLGEMLRASGLGARVGLTTLPALDGAMDLMARGLRSTFHITNVTANEANVRATDALRSHRSYPLLFDPQTSGGLLLSMPAQYARDALKRLPSKAAVIGSVQRGQGIELTEV